MSQRDYDLNKLAYDNQHRMLNYLNHPEHSSGDRNSAYLYNLPKELLIKIIQTVENDTKIIIEKLWEERIDQISRSFQLEKTNCQEPDCKEFALSHERIHYNSFMTSEMYSCNSCYNVIYCKNHVKNLKLFKNRCYCAKCQEDLKNAFNNPIFRDVSE